MILSLVFHLVRGADKVQYVFKLISYNLVNLADLIKINLCATKVSRSYLFHF